MLMAEATAHQPGKRNKNLYTRFHKNATAFNDSDLEGLKFPHDKPLVVTKTSEVKKVLVDNMASCSTICF